jgi:hypothetical protein
LKHWLIHASRLQVLRMEHLVLKVLEFDLSVPTAHLFVNKMCQMIPTEDKVRTCVTCVVCPVLRSRGSCCKDCQNLYHVQKF